MTVFRMVSNTVSCVHTLSRSASTARPGVLPDIYGGISSCLNIIISTQAVRALGVFCLPSFARRGETVEF